MTHLHMIYIASIVGAAVFFVAGAAAATLRRQRAQAFAIPAAAPSPLPMPMPPPPSPLPDPEVAMLRERMRELDVLRARAEQAEAELAKAHAADQQLRGEIERQRRDLATSHGAAQAAKQAEARVAKLTDELAALRATKPIDQATAQRAAEAAAALDRARSEATAAAHEVAALHARVGELERQLADRAHAVRDLSTENEQLKGRLRDAEGIRAEYVRLRTADTDAQFLKSEVARLEAELRALHVEALGGGRSRQARGSQPRPSTAANRAITSAADWTIGDSLATAIERFADDGTRSIAVADAMGFPLASNGNDGVALAAYAALLYESAAKARQFLPLGTPKCIELVDEQGTRVAVWTFDVDSDRLMLANLAVTPVDGKRIETTLADLAAILAPTHATQRATQR